MGADARSPNPGELFYLTGMIKINGSVNDLDKSEVLNKLNETGLMHRYNNDQLWKRAFNLYMQATADKVDIGCGRCYTKVKEWLQKP